MRPRDLLPDPGIVYTPMLEDHFSCPALQLDLLGVLYRKSASDVSMRCCTVRDLRSMHSLLSLVAAVAFPM